jgi:hypothetical protein
MSFLRFHLYTTLFDVTSSTALYPTIFYSIQSVLHVTSGSLCVSTVWKVICGLGLDRARLTFAEYTKAYESDTSLTVLRRHCNISYCTPLCIILQFDYPYTNATL